MFALPRLTKNYKLFETGADGTKISLTSFRRSEKLEISEMQVIKPNNP